MEYDDDITGCSDIIIKKVKKLNPNILIIMFPLCNMYIHPFYYGTSSFLKCKIIDEILLKKTKKEIITLYNNDLIDWKINDSFNYSIDQFKIIEDICINNLHCHYMVKLSDFIVKNYKKVNIFIDRVFPENIVINYLFNQIVNYIQIKSPLFCQNINENLNLIKITQSNRYNFHKNNECLTQEMVHKLSLQYLPTFDSKNKMQLMLEKYLESK